MVVNQLSDAVGARATADFVNQSPVVPSENLVRSAIIEDFGELGQAAPEMGTALFAVLPSIGSSFAGMWPP